MSNIITLDFIDFNLKRTNNIGNNVMQTLKYWRRTETGFVAASGKYSEAVLKLIDEIISNAVDILISPPDSSRGAPGKNLAVTYANGEISVFNDGPGFLIHEDSVQRALSAQYSGSNYEDDGDHIQAGLNGQGAKLTNIYSKRFMVETACAKTKQLYTQVFENNMRKIHPPKVTPYLDKPFTRITFTLDFSRACAISKTELSNDFCPPILGDLIYRRVAETAAYLSLHGNFGVRYNGEKISFSHTTFAAAHALPGDSVHSEILHGGNDTNSRVDGAVRHFAVTVILKKPTPTGKKFTPIGFDFVNILNNVVLTEFPNYAGALLKKLEEALRKHPEFEKTSLSQVKKNIPPRLFADHITLITVGSYPKKHFDFRGQTKSNAIFDPRALENFSKEYSFSEKFIKKLWPAYKEILMMMIKPANKNTKAKPKLYEPAQCLKRKIQAEALFIAEGNTAVQLLQGIIEQNPKLSREKYGLFSIQGVPMNAIKASHLFPQGPVQTESLQQNDGLQSLVNALGLKYNNKRARPNYRYVIITTDQDIIGIGKICSLIIAFFLLYFPDLVRSGFIRRMRTPIIRYYKGNSYKSFYSEREFNLWAATAELTGRAVYYKGLGCNSKYEVQEMARDFEKNIVQINYDEAGENLMHILYGEETGIRKEELLRGVREGSYANELSVNLTEHCSFESISEQLDNIQRMTPNVLDGLLPCQRKVIATTRKMHGELKVSSLSGAVIDRMNYGYGETSVQNAIKYMAQIFPGSNRFPLLLTISDANGSQFYGRGENPAARYCKVTTNHITQLYYPLADDDLLPRVFEEGEYYEPATYISIVPRVLTEDTNAIATGWNSRFVARRMDTVIALVRRAIDKYPYVSCPELTGWASVYAGMKIEVIDGREYCFGSYTATGREIIVTQLPLHLWGAKFIQRLTPQKDTPFAYEKIIESVDNESGKQMRIKITLKPGAADEMQKWKLGSVGAIDPVIEIFHLYKKFSRNLNFFHGDQLKSYLCLDQIFCDWFEARRTLYIRRLKKERIRLTAEIVMLKNLHRFVQNDRGAIDGLEDSRRDEILEKNGYDKLNAGKITKPQICSPEELREKIYSRGSYKYIYALQISQTSASSIRKLGERIAVAEKALESAKKNSWHSVWLEELNHFQHAFDHGVSVGWDYRLMKK